MRMKIKCMTMISLKESSDLLCFCLFEGNVL